MACGFTWTLASGSCLARTPTLLSRGDRGERHGVRCSHSSTLLPSGKRSSPPVVAELGCRRHTSVYGGLQNNFTFFFAALHVAVFALFPLRPRIWPSLPLSGCCLWSSGYWIRGGMLLRRRLLEEIHTFSLARWTRVLRLLGLHARAEWRSVLSRCFSLQFRFCVAHLEI